ncbi:MAG: sigma-70 family RNA polymerase sigma factor [Elainellaceae cyanobacterium]|jgi:RNA polymerase sigma-70 factor (ECF subfamily)|uniref:sigma-70 family RNA polymerase sigma factor n=1 Tax=Leptolyngbya sp. CCY15150 TaxID=2767772 RepID=UPI0019506844|nr:sigma-70 family RNA polymerase sigma factor [Leptolyngbya sp. CCY15150]
MDAPPSTESIHCPSDVDLIQAIRSGQVDALNTLYERYAKLVYSLAFRMLKDVGESEDLTQDTFLALWQRDIYDPSRGSLSRFLMIYVRSRAIDRLRTKGTRTQVLQRWRMAMKSETSGISPLDHVSMGERSRITRDALDQLSDAERQVLEIAYYQGYSQSEVAQKLGIPLGTVKTRSRQGLKKLRKALQQYF